LKRRVFHSVADLQAAINRVLEVHNGERKPFTWTANSDKILAVVRRGHQALNSLRWSQPFCGHRALACLGEIKWQNKLTIKSKS
jgi:hypothetical protein